MTLNLEWETENRLPFDAKELARALVDRVMAREHCPYDVEVDLVITDNEGIHETNREFRGVDAPTDVLSFPMIAFETPGDFSVIEENTGDYLNPDTGELLLGDMMLSQEKVFAQAEEYGHDVRREFAFLIVHSLLHLCGFDHMEDAERQVMEAEQRAILEEMQITR